MERESKIEQLYKTISQKPRTIEEILSSRANPANSPLYFLERVANYLVKNNLIGNYFEQTDFDKLQLDRNILIEIGNSIDSEIEQLSDFKLRKFCKKFIDLFLAKHTLIIGLPNRKSNYFNFIVDLVKPSPNQIIYKPDCHLGSLFIRLNRNFPDYNLKFIGQVSSFKNHSFICKINLFANGIEKASSIYSEDPLDILINQPKAKADIAIATNYLHKLIYTRKEYDLSQLESFEKICTLEVAYIELMLSMTKDNGKVIAVVPDSFLVNDESKPFRKRYLENDLVEKIISLPTTSIIVLNKEKSSENKGFVIFDGKDDARFEETKVSINEILSTDNYDLQVVSYASKERKKEIEERKKDIKEVELIFSNSQYPVKKVKDLVEFSTSGHYHSPSNEVVENSSEILPYVRVSDLTQNRNEFDLDISKVERKISREKAHEKTIIDFSAVLVVAFALNLRRTYFKFTGQPIVIDSNIIALKMKEDVNVEHFLLQLHSRLVQTQVKTMISGGTNNRIDIEDLLNIKIILPPLEEQNRQTIESLKEERKELIEDVAEIGKNTEYNIIARLEHSFNNKLSPLTSKWKTLMYFLEEAQERKQIKLDTLIEPDKISTYEELVHQIDSGLSKLSNCFKVVQKENANKILTNLNEYFKKIEKQYSGENYKIKIISRNRKIFVELDKDIFDEVMEHLINNAKNHAFKIKGDKHLILFELSKIDIDGLEYARILYKDNGVGFPPNFTDERYKTYQDKSSDSEGDGIGGFDINKWVELHNGKVQLLPNSENVTEPFKTQIEILLPLEN